VLYVRPEPPDRVAFLLHFNIARRNILNYIHFCSFPRIYANARKTQREIHYQTAISNKYHITGRLCQELFLNIITAAVERTPNLSTTTDGLRTTACIFGEKRLASPRSGRANERIS
jgi:hypothetical protein